MTVRLTFGLGWSLLTGLAGGWLVMAPWTLDGQGGGDWSTVTRTEFATGLGLILLAMIGIVVVVSQLMSGLREAGVVTAPRSAARAEKGVATSPEMEKALVALAQALADDLDSQRGPAVAGRPGEPASPGWRQQP